MQFMRMRDTAPWLVAAALLAVFAGPVWAQGQPNESNMAQLDIGDGNVSFDVRGRTLAEVVDRIRDKTKVNIILTKEAATATVTLKIQDLHWLVALQEVAEKAECILERTSPVLIKVYRPERVTFSFENEDIKKVVSVIATYSGANIVVSPAVKGTITVNLKNIPWRDALEQIVKTLGYAVVEEDRDILRIIPREDLKQQLETRVVRLKYIRPPSPYRAYLNTEYAKDNIQPYNSVTPEKDFPLLEALKTAVESESGTVMYDRVTNSVIARGTKPALDNLISLVQQIDVEPSQIFFDVKLITTQNEDLLDVGVDPGEDGWTAAITLSAAPTRLPFGVWDDLDRAVPGDPLDPTVSPQPPTTFGTIDFTGMSMALRLFKEDRSSRVVQAPKLVALDNQEATIFVGETVRYAQTTASSNQSGGLTFSIAEAPNSPVQQGFQLLVIPHVIPNSDKIMLTVIPEAEQLVGTSAELPGFDEFTSGEGLNEVSILLPRVSASTIVTHMIVRSGETAVLGGLLTQRDVEVERGIPGLSSIPVIRWLFMVRETQKQLQNLIVFMTPRIIRSSEDIDLSIKEAIREYRAKMEKDWKDMFPEDVLPAEEEASTTEPTAEGDTE
ncbi:MAG: type II secretion system protein GspD [Planctomycetota bacterium]|jgi:type IV pilus assembly protein PilQ